MQKTMVLRKIYWQFFNGGTRYQFNPDKRAQWFGGTQETLGDIHKKLVREINRPDVYMLNHLGELVT